MFAVILGCLACSVQFVFGLLVPGLLLTKLIERMSRTVHGLTGADSSAASRILQCIGLGAIYLAVQMLLLSAISHLDHANFGMLIWAKLIMDMVVCCAFLFCFRDATKRTGVCLSPKQWHVASKLQFLVALVFGVAAIALVPHGLDNSAVGWVTQKLNYLQCDLKGTQGAISYIGFLFVPAAFLNGLVPVPTIAACLKLPLAMLVALVSRRLAEALTKIISIGPLSVAWHALIIQLIVLSTAIGKYGVFDTGKETVFAMVLFFALASELILARPCEQSWYLRIGVLLAASVGFGAMAVPYGFILLSTFILFSWGSINIFRLAFWSIFLSLPGLLASIHGMLDWSIWKSAIVLLVPMLGAGVLIWSGKRFERSDAGVGGPRYVGIISAFAISILIAGFLMPVHFHQGVFPFDGNARFYDMLMFHNKFDFVGFIGIVLLLVGGHVYRKNSGVLTLLCFPFFAAVPVLIMANMGDSTTLPFHPQNVWDWGKDIPRWISGPYLAFFGAIVWHRIMLFAYQSFSSQAKHGRPVSWRNPKFIAVLFVLFLLFVDTRLILKRGQFMGLPNYTSIGGHHDAELADFVEWAYLAKSRYDFLNYNSRPLIVSDASQVNEWLPVLSMYGIHTVRVSDFFDRQIDDEEKYWCVCAEGELEDLLTAIRFENQYSPSVVKGLNKERVFCLSKMRFANETAVLR